MAVACQVALFPLAQTLALWIVHRLYRTRNCHTDKPRCVRSVSNLPFDMSDQTLNIIQKMELSAQVSVALDNRKLGTEESPSSSTWFFVILPQPSKFLWPGLHSFSSQVETAVVTHGVCPSTSARSNLEPKGKESRVGEFSTGTWSVLLIYYNPLNCLDQKRTLFHL